MLEKEIIIQFELEIYNEKIKFYLFDLARKRIGIYLDSGDVLMMTVLVLTMVAKREMLYAYLKKSNLKLFIPLRFHGILRNSK